MLKDSDISLSQNIPAHKATINTRIEKLTLTCNDLLGDQSEINLEIGCGHGHYLVAYADKHRDEFCIGIDLINKRIEKANNKVRRLGLTNMIFFKAHAKELLQVLTKPPSLIKIFILFPDPWPKRRHSKYRLIQPEFLSGLASLASPDASIFFRTDHKEYFKWAKAVFAAHNDWSIEPTMKWPFESSSYFQEMMDDWQSLVVKRSNSLLG